MLPAVQRAMGITVRWHRYLLLMALKNVHRKRENEKETQHTKRIRNHSHCVDGVFYLLQLQGSKGLSGTTAVLFVYEVPGPTRLLMPRWSNVTSATV